jgi:DNA-binding NtrC family response regulator
VNYKILLIEDNAQERTSLEQLLASQGYQVTTAENGKFALDILTENEFDLILTDLIMPVTDGIKFLHTFSKYDMDIPVIVITGHEDIENMLSAFHLGAIDVLYKPYNIDELLSLVQKVLRQEI